MTIITLYKPRSPAGIQYHTCTLKGIAEIFVSILSLVLMTALKLHCGNIRIWKAPPIKVFKNVIGI